MGKTRFTEEQIADFLLQARHGVADKYLCEKYNVSTTTLRRWKENHDAVIRKKLTRMESHSTIVFLCLITAILLLAVVFSKSVAALCIPLMLVHCIVYIIYYRRRSSEFIIRGSKFLARSGPGARNAFYQFSWIFVFLFLFAFIFFIVSH